MAYKTADEIGDQYLSHLKTLKPSVDISQQDTDWWIRSRVNGGIVAGIYADQAKIANDPFPQSARREGVQKSLKTFLDDDFTEATQAVGDIKLTGATGSTIPVGLQIQYPPNGNLYSVTTETLFGDQPSGVVPVQSVVAGQSQNLLEGAALVVVSPPAGIDSAAVVFGGPVSDGRNLESTESGAQRVLDYIRSPPAGGNALDYERYALEADPAVTSARTLRFPFGFGTVGVVITAGTTDIDEAIDNNQPIILMPSDDLMDRVETYIEEQVPITDCASVLRPATTIQDVTIRVKYVSGDNDTILTGQTLTQGELVQREISRAIYKTPTGGRQFTGAATGVVVASEIEEVVDIGLSATPYQIGTYAQILADRQVEDLSSSGPNRGLLRNEIVLPGVISVLETL